MKPTLALVGRPNVGKSTLFNRLVGERRAIVLDIPGVTRDRHYGHCHWAGVNFNVVDTGGFEPLAEEGILASMRRQAMAAVEEADVVVFVLDGKEGMVPADAEVADILRRAKDKVLFAVNKVDNQKQELMSAEFYALGAEHVFPISAEHGRGVNVLLDAVLELFPRSSPKTSTKRTGSSAWPWWGAPTWASPPSPTACWAKERMIVDAVAGTTRDAVDSPLHANGQDFLLVDTAGLRRKSKINPRSSEGFSVVRTLDAIERCHVAVMLIDAVEGPTDQDARIAGYAHEKGPRHDPGGQQVGRHREGRKDLQAVPRSACSSRCPSVPTPPVLFVSALNGQRVHKLLDLIVKVRESHTLRIATGPLNRWLKDATTAHHPPVSKSGHPIRLYFASQPRVAPPTIMISTNDPDGVHFSYQRFLINQFREHFECVGTPIKLQFRGKNNPFDSDEEG
jgi:GTP-binding protein